MANLFFFVLLFFYGSRFAEATSGICTNAGGRAVRGFSFTIDPEGVLEFMEQANYIDSGKDCQALILREYGISRFRNPDDLINYVPGLKILDISGNRFGNCTELMMQVGKLKDLETLLANGFHFDSNCTPWPNVMAGSSNLKKLQILELRQNNFVTQPNAGANGFPSVLPVATLLPKLTELNLANNYLSTLNVTLRNVALNVSSLALDISNNFITNVFIAPFDGLSPVKLESLNLAFNFVQDNDSFQNLFQNVEIAKTLNITGNGLTSLDLDSIGLANLITIDLSYNDLQKIDLTTQTQLQYGYFTHNNFQTLDVAVNSPNLAELDFSNNFIKTGISNTPLIGVSKDFALKLDDNEISSGQSFSKHDIVYLSLESNLLTTLEPDSFSALTKLKSLDVSEQRKQPDKTFNFGKVWPDILCSLNFLGVSKNQITELEVDIGELDCKSSNRSWPLQLDFSDNQISSVYVNSGEEREISEIDLESNSLETIVSDSFQGVIDEIDISRNYNLAVIEDYAFSSDVVEIKLDAAKLLCCNITGLSPYFYDQVEYSSEFEMASETCKNEAGDVVRYDEWSAYHAGGCTCDSSCSTCIGPLSTDCITCADGLFMTYGENSILPDGFDFVGTCASSCPSGATETNENGQGIEVEECIDPVDVTQPLNRTPIIIGLSVGIPIFIIIVIIIVIVLMRYQKKRAKQHAEREFAMADPSRINELFADDDDDQEFRKPGTASSEYMVPTSRNGNPAPTGRAEYYRPESNSDDEPEMEYVDPPAPAAEDVGEYVMPSGGLVDDKEYFVPGSDTVSRVPTDNGEYFDVSPQSHRAVNEYDTAQNQNPPEYAQPLIPPLVNNDEPEHHDNVEYDVISSDHM